MAFLARRGLPEQLVLHILELAGPETIAEVCATSKENRDFVAERMAPCFRNSWYNIIALPPFSGRRERKWASGAKNIRIMADSAFEPHQHPHPWPQYLPADVQRLVAHSV